MNNISYVIGAKEEIPSKYLDELLNLQQKNREEILPGKPPSIEFYKIQWIYGSYPESKTNYILAINKEDKIIGYGYANWNIKYDNLDRGYFWIYVRKNERRKKIGTNILREIMKIYPKQITTITSEIFEFTDAVHFIRSFKEKENYIEILSQSDLSKFDPKVVRKEAERQRNEALKKGYEIIYIENLEHVFHLNFPKYVQMVEEIWNDMPREELTYEDDVLTLDRYQTSFQIQILMGNKVMLFVAIHKETNEPVGLTCTYVNKYKPDIALQEDTGIIRAHRGKSLGLALKYQMLDKLLNETKAEFWRTGNAGSNEHMLRINRFLKHEPYQKIFVYEFTKDELLEKLNPAI
ncbi:MAG: GNAT family N-acetyltransferase [Asgard group archaeon]|nr:GNAT family N-acetyltransferase [Asgard group archaeon]